MQDSFLIEIWREACKHIELHDSTVAISKLVARRVSISQILVRRLTLEPETLITIAGEVIEKGLRLSEDKQTLSKSEATRIQDWCSQIDPLLAHKNSGGIARLVLPESVEGSCFLIPLGGRFGSKGILIICPQSGEEFSKDDLRVLETLREPFAVALDNDLHVHEISTLRAAAESDRGALLQKLGRKELADVIVGEQAGLKTVLERVDLVAGSDVPVLILGETGTGKELIARALHMRGKFQNGPFIRVNCGAIPQELIDSQLFGHEKGSFTGAEQSRQGWFERADGGTLFLDEIGELPLEAQVRFLRVLQDGFVERVGGNHPIHVSVRVVAATHRELANMVHDGTFREDLWYRLAVFPIMLPPLRERRNDIPALVEHFSLRASHRFGLPHVKATQENIEALQNYDWPGNIRELGAVIDRAVILGGGKSLDVQIALGYGKLEVTPKRSSLVAVPTPQKADHILSLDEVVKAHIEDVLKQVHGRVEGRKGAAALLKINPHTLRARMRKLGIDWSSFRDEE
jgi:transcriptional regulator with GAF, ATPase, and Fis domain